MPPAASCGTPLLSLWAALLTHARSCPSRAQVLENPELASGFANPKVQAAIFDISQNPMNVVKYQEDPEVMKVLEKVTELFTPAMQAKAGGGGAPGAQ